MRDSLGSPASALMASDFILDVDPEAVDLALETYLQDSNNPATEVLNGARLHRMLPLWEDWVGCIGLRRSGEIIFYTWDEPSRLVPVGTGGDHDRRMVFAARAQGARRFPSIAGLAPVRGPSARVCPGCGGTGKLRDLRGNGEFAELADRHLVCQCGGLGWVPW